MAFCNSCGTNLENGAKFCPKCGAVQSAVSAVTPAVPSTTASRPQGNSAVKLVLTAVAAVVILGMLGMVAVTIIGLRIARHTKIENENGNVRIESPFGKVESTNDPEKVSQSLGIDIYPGAHVLEGHASNVTLGDMHTVSADFETDNSSDKVTAFYKLKFPNPTVSSTTGGNTTIVATDKQNVVTITIEAEGGKTRIHIANVTGKRVTSSSGA